MRVRVYKVWYKYKKKILLVAIMNIAGSYDGATTAFYRSCRK